jgi:hypothetical protein
MGFDQRQYLAMGLEMRDVAAYLDEDLYFETSDEDLEQFIQLNPNHFEEGFAKLPETFENLEISQFFSDYRSRDLERIFVTDCIDGNIRLKVRGSLEKLLRIWKVTWSEFAGLNSFDSNYVPECFYRVEGLLHFVVDQYLVYIDEGGPVTVQSSKWGVWMSLGEMVEDEPYLIYNEWEYMYDGRWDDPRENKEDRHYMLATQRALVGEDHEGFILLEPIFGG